METLPSPEPESKSADDYSDIESEASEGEEKGRKYQRGGRKVGSVDTTAEELELLQGAQDDNNTDEDQSSVASAPCKYCAGKAPATQRGATKKVPDEPFETGLRAFNIKKATGGGRPVTIRRPSSRRHTRAKSTKRKAKPATPRSDGDVNETEAEDRGSRTARETGVPEAPAGCGGAGKPMSIRLDLNLMVEVFLRAKIQGDVTVTFLYGSRVSLEIEILLISRTENNRAPLLGALARSRASLWNEPGFEMGKFNSMHFSTNDTHRAKCNGVRPVLAKSVTSISLLAKESRTCSIIR